MSYLKSDKTTTLNGLKVNEYLLTRHNPNGIDMPSYSLPSKPLGITVHNTDWIDVSSSTTPAEQYTRATVNGNMKDVRVHYYVDNVCAWQTLPLSLSGWHAADGNGDGNRKTISIECIMSYAYNDRDKKSEDNCAKLVAYLLNKYGLNVENNLFTHSHWLNYRDGKRGTNDYLNTAYNVYKNCPAYILPHWSNFKTKVQTYLNKLQNKTPNDKPTNKPIGDKVLYRVRKTWTAPSSQIGAFSVLDNAIAACKDGYSVFDENGKVVYTSSKNSPSSSGSNVEADVFYRVYSSNKWWEEVKDYNEENSDGYAGIEGSGIKGLAIKSSKGTLKYRVHIKGGGWLSWITDYDINNWRTGCAGNKVKEIDAIQITLENIDGYKVKYRVSTTRSNGYLDWITDYNIKDSMGYAGIYGQAIDKVQIDIVKE